MLSRILRTACGIGCELVWGAGTVARVATSEHRNGLLRARGAASEHVTSMELFFDLVYVFAVTQLSHLLIEHLSVRGAFQILLILMAVWWAWMYTTWATNWFDPNQPAVRLMLVGVMLVSLIMAAAIPQAFGERGLLFAGAYVVIQLGRTGFILLATRHEAGLHRNFQRIVCWLLLSGVFWIAGGLAEGSAREALWLVAVLVDLAGPACGFYTPRLGRSHTTDWAISGSHMAERCQLFLILSLGESILVTGTTLSGMALTRPVVAAFVLAFIGSVTFWWIYFNRSAEWAAETIAASDDPGRLGRNAYTYYHLPMVAGIIVTAAADELVIAHPEGHTATATIAVVLGGPALFLAGHALFKWVVGGQWTLSRWVAIGALAALVPVGMVVSPLALAGAAVAVIVSFAAWDTWAYHRLAGVAQAGEQPAS